MRARVQQEIELEVCFLRLLHDEYEVVGGEASDVQKDEPSLREAAPSTCRVQIIAPEISADFDRRAEEMLAQLVAVGAR